MIREGNFDVDDPKGKFFSINETEDFKYDFEALAPFLQYPNLKFNVNHGYYDSFRFVAHEPYQGTLISMAFSKRHVNLVKILIVLGLKFWDREPALYF